MHQYFIHRLHSLAKKHNRHLVFPEGTDERILKAVSTIQRKRIAARITLLGSAAIIRNKVKKINCRLRHKKLEIIDPKNSELTEKFSQKLYQLRKSKGLTLKEAKNLVTDPNWFGTMMVQEDLADGMISGAVYSSADTVRPALQIIKTKNKYTKAYGSFLLLKNKQAYLFADTTINIEPEPKDMADFAIDLSILAQKFGMTPKIAFLSFSTKGSAHDPRTEKVKKAYQLAKKKNPKLIMDGELQFDAATVPEIAARKCPKSPIKGDANIFIFPDLESANIAYKIAERLGKFRAIGTITRGFKKPVNDLSRGCSVRDIVNLAAVTVLECKN